MKLKGKKRMALFCAVCVLGVMAAGCGSGSEDASAPVETDETPAANPAEQETTEPGDAETPEEEQGDTQGRWKVLDPEVAAAVDADFSGEVWKIGEDSFFIAEKKVMLDEDGSIISSSPSSNAEIPDSDLIEVVFDEDTYFYMRTIQGSGESHEDADAGFSDLEKGISVELKGSFEKEIFYAEEIRILKIS